MQTLSQPFYARLLIVAAVLHLCAAWFSVGHYGYDEYHYILELVAHKMGYVSSGEFDELGKGKTRSAILLSIAYGILQILPDNANAPFTAAFILRLLSVILACAASLAFFLAYQKDIKSEAARRWVLAAMLLCWVLVFFHARYTIDGWAGSLIMLGLASLRWNRFLLTGVFWGMAFAVRFQAVFMLLPLGLWVLFILRPKPAPANWRGARDIALLAAGGVAVLLGGFLVDSWFYGEPILTWLNYIQVHPHLEADVSYYSKIPPEIVYWRDGGTLVAPIGYILPIVLAAFWLKFPRHPLVWATVLHVAFHLWWDNRIFRFMYPIAIFMPFITAMVWQEFIEQRAALRRGFLWLLKITAAINLPLVVFIAFYPVDKEIILLRDCALPNMQDDTPVYYFTKGKIDRITREFYLREKTMTRVKDESELREHLLNSGESEALYISRKPRTSQLEENGIHYTRLCSVIPEWVLRFNFNNWTARAGIYPVYRVRLE